MESGSKKGKKIEHLTSYVVLGSHLLCNNSQMFGNFQQKKRLMVSSAFGEDETGGRQTRLTVDDLKYLFMAD